MKQNQYTTYYLDGRLIDKKDLPKDAEFKITKKITTQRKGIKTKSTEKYYETADFRVKQAASERKFFDNLQNESFGDSDEWHGTDNHGWVS